MGGIIRKEAVGREKAYKIELNCVISRRNKAGKKPLKDRKPTKRRKHDK